MEKIAFILGDYFFYWSTVLITLGAAAAICLFLSLYCGKSKHPTGGFAVVPVALVLSVLTSRILHWYCYEESYPSLMAAITDYSQGGFALLGCFAGCLLAAVVTRLIRFHRNLPMMLDCMCLAGGAGIAVGRLASFFNASDRGQIVESIHTLPWVYPVVNSVSGVTEYRLATFMLQAMVVGAFTLLIFLWYVTKRETRRKDGDAALLFLLCYGASEIVLDSTRYDSMYFRSNGFVSIVQVLGAVVLGMCIVIFSVRLVKNRGFRKWYIAMWMVMAALVGCAGYMEYHVQRHGNEAVFAYSVMSGCLLALVCMILAIRMAAVPKTGLFLKQRSHHSE